jgi:5-methylcytosine-specific restriction endonuclease McrA
MTPKQKNLANVVYNLRLLGYTIKKPASIKEVAMVIKKHTNSSINYNSAKKYRKLINLFNKTSVKHKEEDLSYIVDEMHPVFIKKSKRIDKVKTVKHPPAYHYKDTSIFYKSPEYRKLRYEVLAEQNGTCQLCGRTRKDGCIMHLDHIVPISKDWTKRLDKDNMQILCEDCNLGKSNLDDTDWR